MDAEETRVHILAQFEAQAKEKAIVKVLERLAVAVEAIPKKVDDLLAWQKEQVERMREERARTRESLEGDK